MSTWALWRWAALLASVGLIGCARGPKLSATLSFNQGPSFTLSFQAEPVCADCGTNQASVVKDLAP